MAGQKKRRRVPAARRHRLPGRALSRRAADGDPRNRRRARHRRGAGDPGGDRRRAAARGPRGARRSVALRRARPSDADRSRPTADPGAPDARAASRAASRERRRRTLPTYLYDADDAAPPDDAEALRLREDRRRLRLHLRVLHHPDAARRSTAAGTTESIVREARALAARGVQGTAPHLAGHDVLRRSTAANAARSRGCCAS